MRDYEITEYTIAVTRSVEKLGVVPRAIPSGVVPYEIREGVYEKNNDTRSWHGETLSLASIYIHPFPISPMSRVVFVSRRKADARARTS